MSLKHALMLSGVLISDYRLPLHEFGTLCRRTFVHPAFCRLSSVGSRPHRLKTELFLWSFSDWCDCVNFRLVCYVALQLWLMAP